tara:strand:+ start:975 stop:1220 length:246 start_codon:yes stop_codon:yes gene_type:complete
MNNYGKIIDNTDHVATAENAISRSVSHNEIVTIVYTDILRLELFMLSDDDAEFHSDNSIVHEFWGKDENNNDWRVHLNHQS